MFFVRQRAITSAGMGASVSVISRSMRSSDPMTDLVVHDDGWEIAGCPVNGPAIAADANRVAVAWFTAAGSPPVPRVRIAFSHDGGRRFDPPIEVSDGRPEGRVDVVFLEDGAALVTWIDANEGSAQIVAQSVDTCGLRGSLVRIASSTAARATGFPRMAALQSFARTFSIRS